jgi:tRNA/tmRNA/rRNA uracil-C5-methylase (TrmA/RlmC/RlmD family)
MIGADAYIDEVVAGVRLRVSAAAFFQPSPAGAEALVDAVRVLGGDELQSATLVADLYAGVGLFSACAVPPSGHVTAVEVSPVAAADARVNLSGRHASVIEAHVNSSIGVAADVVIADPPRAGLGAIGVAAVAATGASTILLVSCDPAAGARDIRLLCEGHGFCLESTWVVDQFPFTSHVEMVSRLVRA